MSIKTEHDIYSPRWGHTDKYNVTLTKSEMKIKQSNRKTAICKKNANGNPVWTGHNSQSNNPLMSIFSDDSIPAPEVVPFALEHGWQKWLDGAVTDAEMEDGLNEFFSWIDSCARNKPDGKVWSNIF